MDTGPHPFRGPALVLPRPEGVPLASRVLAACLVLLAFGPASASPGGDPDSSELDSGVARGEVPETPGGPLAVFAAVELAWMESGADALIELLDPEERVSLAFVSGGPRGGWFNRDQAYFLLKDMFEFSSTDRFEFRRYWNLDSQGRSPYAVAERGFRMNDGALHEDQVYISLRRRGDLWYIGEIRSIDR